MVTMPTEAASSPDLIHDLLHQGMNCMRINCAHDDADTWVRMIEHLRRAQKALGKTCRVFMDLSGPKLRTGPLEPGPAVVRIRPRRDIYGTVVAPARIWLTAKAAHHAPPTEVDALLPVSPAWLATLQVGEEIHLIDARLSKRTFMVVDVTSYGCWAESSKTAYIVPGTVLRRQYGHAETKVADFPPQENALLLNSGDILHLTRNLKPGRRASLGHDGRVLTPATIGCTLPEALEKVQPGELIWFDDGKIGGKIDGIDNDRLTVRITHARPGGVKLRADKGINLPESDIQLAAMTAKDVEDLSFVARHADAVQLSFANNAQDVEALQQHLQRLGDRKPAIVLKVETKRGFENLPEMMLTAMRWPSCGVMIARGDLAIECGFERLAEVQEEILWICEAAHIPVIWATQVLETCARTGVPSRAEISDASMGRRAECVMLNKGPYILSAVRVLDDIIRRMQAHQAKKASMLRGLQLAQISRGRRLVNIKTATIHQHLPDRPDRSLV
jgi:pyruvate kinase